MCDKPVLQALVVGCGRIGGGYNRGPNDTAVLTHALAYVRHPRYSLAACVDPDPAARADFAQRWGVSACFSSLEEALANGSFDIVSLCSPTGTHLKSLRTLLDVNVPRLFAEKPLDGDVEGAEAIAGQYAIAQRALVVNLPRRWDPTMRNLRDEIAQDKWGVLRSVVGWYSRGVVNNGVHLFDLVAFLVGKGARVRHVTGRRDDGVDGDPTVDAVLDIAEVPFHLIGCDGRDHARFELTFSFSRGVIEILEGGLYLRKRPIQRSTMFAGVDVIGDAERIPTGYSEAMLRALDELAEWQPGQRLTSDATSAIKSIALAIEVRAVAETLS